MGGDGVRFIKYDVRGTGAAQNVSGECERFIRVVPKFYPFIRGGER